MVFVLIYVTACVEYVGENTTKLEHVVSFVSGLTENMSFLVTGMLFQQMSLPGLAGIPSGASSSP
eukprot:11106740-Alexandrium_andersonii.AAC.1